MNKQVLGHILACISQIMWGSTFVFTKVLLQYFLPVEILFIRCILAIVTLFLFYPHVLKPKEKKHELYFAAAGLCGIAIYFMLENTALTLTYASNVGIIVACAPFFVAVVVGYFFNEKPKRNFFIGFIIAMIGIVLVSLNGQSSFHLNPLGDFMAFCAMISWGFYSALIKKIEEWNYPTIATTRRIQFYGMLFLIPILCIQHSSIDFSLLVRPDILANFLYLGIASSALGFLVWNLSTKWIGAIKTSVYIYVSPVVTIILSMLVLNEQLTLISILGSILIFIGLIISQKKFS